MPMVDVTQSRYPSIRILALPESSSGVLYGLFEVLSTFADSWSALMSNDRVEAGFDVRIVARDRDMFRCYGGAPVMPQGTLSDTETADVVIVTDLAVNPRQDHRQLWLTSARG